jgi:hypothetical protein
MTTSDGERVLDAWATAGAVLSADRLGVWRGATAWLVTTNAAKPAPSDASTYAAEELHTGDTCGGS